MAIQTWAEAKRDWLQRCLRLPNGVPSHDTFGRVFAALDARQFDACFMRRAAPPCPALADQVVLLDGKTMAARIEPITACDSFGIGLRVRIGRGA